MVKSKCHNEITKCWPSLPPFSKYLCGWWEYLSFLSNANQVLEEKYGGWQNISMVNYFNDFANLCFERFGNRVKYWITFNNPWVGQQHMNQYSTTTIQTSLCLNGTRIEYNRPEHWLKRHTLGSMKLNSAFSMLVVCCCRRLWDWGTCTWTEDERNWGLQSCPPYYQGKLQTRIGR